MRFTPPHVEPSSKRLGRLAFFKTFIRNPLEVIPRAAYEEDFVAAGDGIGGRVWITSPALVKAVLLDEREKFGKITQIRLLGPLLGRGILTSEGADWKWQRQASAPMFRPQDLLGFVPAFVRVTDEVIARWRAAPTGSLHRVDVDMTRATFDVISATLLPSADPGVFERSIGTFQKSGSWGILYAAVNAPRWTPRPGIFSGARAVVTLRSAVAGMVRERRALGERNTATPDDLLHRLMAAHDPESAQSMNDEQLVDNLLTFYLAGHETTAKALTWTLYLLARSPEWTAALVDEIALVTGGAPVTGDHVERLVLVRQVLKESMRIYPPVPMMSRQAVTDVRLDGHDLKAGASVLMPIYAIHRHAARWEDPHVFDPTRFSPEREAQIPRYQYMPFGAGPRICIGMSFAMLEATVMLATMLQQMRFEAVEGRDPIPVARVTLVPKNGMMLRVMPNERIAG
jgi:cytochrome P450